MAARPLLSDLPRGHRLPDASLEPTGEDVSRYVKAVGDASALYLERRLVPPLAVAAFALGALLEVVELPAGTLHTGQEVEAHGGAPIGAALRLAGRIAQRSERGGFIVSVIEFEVTPAAWDTAALSGRTTVLAPANASSGGST